MYIVSQRNLASKSNIAFDIEFDGVHTIAQIKYLFWA